MILVRSVKTLQPRVYSSCVYFSRNPCLTHRGFVLGEIEMEFKKIPVYCPRCKTRVLYWNGITKMQIATKCKGCGRYVIYNPEKDETKVKPFEPERQSASGKRFY